MTHKQIAPWKFQKNFTDFLFLLTIQSLNFIKI